MGARTSKFVEEKSAEEPVQLDTAEGQVQQVIDTPEGQFTITFTLRKGTVLDRHSQQAFGNGYLSVEQANLILNHLLWRLPFVNKDDIFQYYNDNTPADEMIFKRTPSQVGRNVELCHPPKYLDKVKTIMKGLREGSRTSMKCGSSLSREVSLSTSPTLQCTMKTENSKVCWSMFRIFNPTVRLIRTISVD